MATEYVKNEELLAEFVKWREDWKALSNFDMNKKPPPSEFMTKAFLEIPVNFSRTPKFYGYTYRDEMCADATAALLENFWKFDPKISQKPFSFLTQICYFTFITFITKERKQSYIKYVSVNDFLTNAGEILDAEENDIKENVQQTFARHYNESLVAHHDGTVAKIKKHNSIIENSIENLLCPDFNPEELKKEIP